MIRLRHFPISAFAIVMAVLLLQVTLHSAVVIAAEPVYTPWYSNKAIKGYDAVAYFTQGIAVKGDKNFTFRWREADWYFASAEHRDMFMLDPEKFAPQYGGFYAYGIAEGHKVGVDPEQFTVYEGKLYLNFNASVNRKWRKRMLEYIESADQEWSEMVQQW